MTPRAAEAPTDRELLEILASVERIAPELLTAFIAAVLKSMPRAKYLALIQQVERLRS